MITTSLSFIKKHSFVLLLMVLSFNLAYLLPHAAVLAHGGDTDLIHGCIRPLTGLLRLVGAGDNCGPAETAVHWPATSGPGGGGANSDLVLGGGWIEFEDLFVGHDFSSSHLGEVIFSQGNLTGANFANSTFYGGSMSGVNLTNADLSNTLFKSYSLSQSDLTGANFSGAHFASGYFQSVDFSVANTTGVTFDGGYFEWIDVTCPDGTNSDDNGETCIGHF